MERGCKAFRRSQAAPTRGFDLAYWIRHMVLLAEAADAELDAVNGKIYQRTKMHEDHPELGMALMAVARAEMYQAGRLSSCCML